MGAYDQAARYAVKLEPKDLFAWLLPAADVAFARWLDTQTIPWPGEPDRRCDTVAELVPAGGLGPPWAIVLELQTRPDPDLPERLLEYLARLRREHRHGPHGQDKYPMGAAVMNLTGPPQEGSLDMTLPGATGLELRFRPRVVTLSHEDAAATLAGMRAGLAPHCLLPWVSLMRGGDQPARIAEWKEVAGMEPSPRRREEYAGLAFVFAELAGCLPAWREGLEGWNVEESRIVQEWQAQALAKGLKLGRQEGRQETLRDNLLKLLAVRSSGAVPADVLAAVQAQADADRLAQWFDLLLAGATLEQFRTALTP